MIENCIDQVFSGHDAQVVLVLGRAGADASGHDAGVPDALVSKLPHEQRFQPTQGRREYDMLNNVLFLGLLQQSRDPRLGDFQAVGDDILGRAGLEIQPGHFDQFAVVCAIGLPSAVSNCHRVDSLTRKFKLRTSWTLLATI